MHLHTSIVLRIHLMMEIGKHISSFATKGKFYGNIRPVRKSTFVEKMFVIFNWKFYFFPVSNRMRMLLNKCEHSQLKGK